MKRFYQIGFGLLVAAVLLAPLLAVAKTDKKKRAYDKVSAVDAAKNTITIASGDKGDTKDYVVDNFTAIVINGKPGKLADVQTDMKADLTVRSDGKTLTKLEVTDPPEDKDKTKK